MSIELNWETLTGGPDGAELAERIRDFIHTKFQGVPLPRFIKSVTVHEFAFGSIPPEVALKDICDPLPDFYEDNGDLDDDEEDEEQGGGHSGGDHAGGGDYGERHRQSGPDSAAHALGRMDLDGGDHVPDAIRMAERRRLDEQRRRFAGGGGGRADSPGGGSRGFGGHNNNNNNNSSSRQEAGEFPFPPHIRTTGLRSAPATPADIGTPTFVGLGASTPGIPGGTSNMHFFQSKLAAATAAGGWPGVGGSQTPLAAVAGAQHLNGWLADHHDRHHQYPSSAGSSPRRRGRRRSSQSQAGGGGGGGGGFPPPAQGYRGGGGGGHERNPSQSSISVTDFAAAAGGASLAPPPPPLREKHSVSTLAPTSAGAPSRPPTRDMAGLGAAASAIDEEDDYGEDEGNSSNWVTGGDGQGKGGEDDDDDEDEPPRKYREPRPEDMQTVFRIRYAGDVRLMLTAEILLDYPMPSFVGIPVKLNITGLTFDGVGVLAYIRKRVHFCFLSPEDALAAVGESEDEDEDEEQPGQQQQQKRQQGHGHAATPGAGGSNDGGPGKKEKGRLGGLLQEIRVESEIGQREGSKQSLKNVGKVERFVLEQVRRIFEEEFVYPSFWTFLV